MPAPSPKESTIIQWVTGSCRLPVMTTTLTLKLLSRVESSDDNMSALFWTMSSPMTLSGLAIISWWDRRHLSLYGHKRTQIRGFSWFVASGGLYGFLLSLLRFPRVHGPTLSLSRHVLLLAFCFSGSLSVTEQTPSSPSLFHYLSLASIWVD